MRSGESTGKVGGEHSTGKVGGEESTEKDGGRVVCDGGGGRVMTSRMPRLMTFVSWVSVGREGRVAQEARDGASRVITATYAGHQYNNPALKRLLEDFA